MSYTYSQSDYGDLYANNGSTRGRCSVCGDVKQHRHESKPQYFKKWYHRVFQRLDIFRGNDEYKGMICRKCLHDGRVAETNRFHPNQLKEEATK
jgi:hypothetical protein